jgi:hypothetical protein
MVWLEVVAIVTVPLTQTTVYRLVLPTAVGMVSVIVPVQKYT